MLCLQDSRRRGGVECKDGQGSQRMAILDPCPQARLQAALRRGRAEKLRAKPAERRDGRMEISHTRTERRNFALRGKPITM